jgi:hypothetical protein
MVYHTHALAGMAFGQTGFCQSAAARFTGGSGSALRDGVDGRDMQSEGKDIIESCGPGEHTHALDGVGVFSLGILHRTDAQRCDDYSMHCCGGTSLPGVNLQCIRTLPLGVKTASQL